MTVKRNVEAHFRKWHIGEEATIDHLVRSLAPAEPHVDNRVHEAMTANGLCVEDQFARPGTIRSSASRFSERGLSSF